MTVQIIYALFLLRSRNETTLSGILHLSGTLLPLTS